MNGQLGFVVGQVLGLGFAASTIFFPLTYFALKKQLGLEFSWGQIAALFLICGPITGIAKMLIGGGPELSSMDIISFFIPILVAAFVICVAHEIKSSKNHGVNK